MNVGNYIKELRISRGLSQEELGKIVGVQRAAVQKWEAGKVCNLKRETILKLAEYFGVTPASFFSEKEKSSPELSEEEKGLLELFRDLPEDKQRVALEMLKAALSASQ